MVEAADMMSAIDSRHIKFDAATLRLFLCNCYSSQPVYWMRSVGMRRCSHYLDIIEAEMRLRMVQSIKPERELYL